MNKIIPIGIAAFVVIAIAALYILPNSNSSSTSSTTSVQRGTTTIIPTSTTHPTTTIPNSNSISCISKNSIQQIYNGNFSTGTYVGWNTSGVGFGKQPANITYDDEYSEYYGQPWTGYNGTYFATSYSGGLEVAAGNLTSKPFLVTEPYINFKVISPQDNGLYVQILQAGRPEVTVHYNTFAVPIINTTNTTNKFDSESNFFNASIVVVPLLCQNVQIKVVAGLVGTQGNQFNYIAVTNFTMAKQPASTPGIIVNQTFNYT